MLTNTEIVQHYIVSEDLDNLSFNQRQTLKNIFGDNFDEID